MITADQITLHLIGDYVTQSHWMANEKTKHLWIATIHALVYSIPFAVLNPSITAWLVIFISHAVIDRYRLARFVVWMKNILCPDVLFKFKHEYNWPNCKQTGYPAECPVWLAVWLMIICDNVMHICINGLALRYL